MTLPLLLTILVLGELPGSYCTVTTVGDLAVLEGQSVTVPCHYNPQYISHVKYWCYSRMKDFCSTLARTDDPESATHSKGKVTIADDPTQHVFTVSMQDLTEGDSGWYSCGVELGRMLVSHSTASLYISVVQGLSVVNSILSADEGRSVTVQCLYSKNLRSSKKRWCRSGNSGGFSKLGAQGEGWLGAPLLRPLVGGPKQPPTNASMLSPPLSGNWNSCMVTNSEGTFSSRNVLIHDDRNSMFTVTLTQLEMRDSGWYWCGAGQQHVAVHVSVTTLARPPVQNLKATVRNSSVMSPNYPNRHDQLHVWLNMSKPQTEHPWKGPIRNRSGSSQKKYIKKKRKKIRKKTQPRKKHDQLNVWLNMSKPQTEHPRKGPIRNRLGNTQMKYKKGKKKKTWPRKSRPVWECPLVASVVLLVLTVSLALWKWRKQCKKKQKQQRTNEVNDNLTMCPQTEGDHNNASVIFLNTPSQQVQML